MKRFLLALFCAGVLAAAEQTFDLETAKTEIAFRVHSTLHMVHGTFKLKRGRIQFNPETGKATGEIVIDVASGESGNGSRDKRMQNEILESPKYPEAVFTPDHIEGHLAPLGPSEIDIHGKFTIHGAEHELTMHSEVRANGDEYVATTHFNIPYIAWGMKNPSNFLLKVDDKVEMEVRATLTSKP